MKMAAVRERQIRLGGLTEGVDFRFLPAVGMTVGGGRNDRDGPVGMTGTGRSE